MGDKFAWIKRKELGLPLGVWAVIVAVGLLWLYRRHQAAASGSTSGTSSTGAGVATGADTGSGGASDASGALAGVANEVALETQLLTNVLDKLQGKKKKKPKPHKKVHHPKKHKAPVTSKTPVVVHRHRKKIRKVRPKHVRSSLTAAWLRTPKELKTLKAQTATSHNMGVRQGALRKPPMGILPKQPAPALAHPRGELDVNAEHTQPLEDRSFTRGTTTVAKRNPMPVVQEPREVEHRHPAHTKGRKH